MNWLGKSTSTCNNRAQHQQIRFAARNWITTTESDGLRWFASLFVFQWNGWANTNGLLFLIPVRFGRPFDANRFRSHDSQDQSCRNARKRTERTLHACKSINTNLDIENLRFISPSLFHRRLYDASKKAPFWISKWFKVYSNCSTIFSNIVHNKTLFAALFNWLECVKVRFERSVWNELKKYIL